MMKIKNKTPIVIFVLSFLTILLFQSHFITNISASRIMTIQALVEHHTFAIDDIPYFTTIDKIYHNGHFYSSKPPLVSLLGAGVYFLAHFLTGAEFSLNVYLLIKIFTVILPFSLLLMFFYKSMKWYDIQKEYKILIPFFLGFATILFPYSVILQNHTLSTFLIFLSFYCLLKNTLEKEKGYLVFLCGLFGSLAVATEFVQSSIILFVFFVYLIISLKKKSNIWWFILGSLPVAILYVIYNIHTTGSFLPPYANFNNLYGYADSYWQNPTGIDAYNHNKLLYFFNILFGTHGLFLYSPVLIFGAIGLYKIIKDKKDKLNTIAKMAAVAILSVVLVIGISTSNYGGTTFGMRWFIIFYPLLLFFAPPIISKIKKPIPSIIFLGLIAFSVFLNYNGMLDKWELTAFTIGGVQMASPFLDVFRSVF